MATIKGSLIVRAPAERVWAFVTDAAGLGRWLLHVEGFTDVGRWPQTGGAFRFRWRFLGASGFGVGQIIHHEPVQKLICSGRCDTFAFTWDLGASTRGAGCRVTLAVQYEGKASAKAGPFLNPLTLQQLLRCHLDVCLHSLRALAERGSSPYRQQTRDVAGGFSNA